MSAHLEIFGLSELRQLLRALPDALVAEASRIVQRNAEIAETQLIQAYPPKTVQEHQLGLREGVRLDVHDSRFGVEAELKSRSPVAHLWEFGTVERFTAEGWPRGHMPANQNHGLVTIARRTRTQIIVELSELVVRHGLHVTRTA